MSRTEHFEIFERTKSAAEHAQHIYSRSKRSILKLKRPRSYTILLLSVKFNNRIKTGGFNLFLFFLGWQTSARAKLALGQLSGFFFGFFQSRIRQNAAAQHKMPKQLIKLWTLSGSRSHLVDTWCRISCSVYLVVTHLRALNLILGGENVIISIFVSGLHKLW